MLFLLIVVHSAASFDFSICATPQQAKQELGNDYYAFCEHNIALSYAIDTQKKATLQQENPVVLLQNDSSSVVKNNSIGISGLLSNLSNSRETHSGAIVTFLEILGLLLFLLLFLLVTIHFIRRKRETNQTINKLLLHLRAYKEANYTNQQLAALLSEKGYTSTLISKLLKALEKKP